MIYTFVQHLSLIYKNGCIIVYNIDKIIDTQNFYEEEIKIKLIIEFIDEMLYNTF